MSKPTLYLMVGYPGAGKTTVAKIIAELTGAVHLWADQERQKMFGEPTHSKAESRQLYAHMNREAERLLAEGQSVVFDTNFNFLRDRERLRRVAAEQGASAKLIWLITDRSLAFRRAALESEGQPTRLFGNMKQEVFERMADHLEMPTAAEQPVKIDGQNVTAAQIKQALGL